MLSRRHFLSSLTALGVSLSIPSLSLSSNAGERIRRTITSSGQSLPVIGMGTWITFDIGDDPDALATRIQVLKRFFAHGGGMIDSSPMYGTSEAVIGRCLDAIENDDSLFSATKVWTWGKDAGIRQMQSSMKLWGMTSLDLMQIHNMLDWETHIETLRDMKQEGLIRYIGITTSHGRRHSELESVLNRIDFDFVQFTYNVIDREAEQRLLPLARERDIAVIINRPFRGGELFPLFQHKPLPTWAKEFDCHNWAQYFLKFIISHPAVTCAIPATSQVVHMAENMGAGVGRLPDDKTRMRMIRYLENLSA